MAGYEQTIIVGNVGRDPETRQLPSGDSVTSFTVAVSRAWRDRSTNEQKESTNWYSVSLWGNRFDGVLPYIRKGKQVMIIGTVSARPYKDRDGNPKASLELKADTIQLLGNRGDTDTLNDDNMGSYHPNSHDSDSQPKTADDIPF
ncbi:single-stranded DNA-binding protein [Aggregatilineales bacterium SYSU G02658]